MNNPLREEIKYRNLEKIASELTDCFYRAVEHFPIYPEFFSMKENTTPNNTSVLRIRTPNSISNMLEYHQHIWDKFHYECPMDALELEYAIDICIDNSIIKQCIIKTSLIKQFLMDKLYIILSTIPSIHNDHTLCVKPDYPRSPGPVSIWNIVKIRNDAGLPISKYLEFLDDFNLYD